MKAITITGLGVIAYSSILFFRSDGLVELLLFGMGGNFQHNKVVFAVYLYAYVLFTLGTGLLIKAHRNRWLRSIRIMATTFEVTDANVAIVVRAILITGQSLLIGLATTLVPTSDLRLSRIELGGCFVTVLIGGFGSAIWASRKLDKAERCGGARPTKSVDHL